MQKKFELTSNELATIVANATAQAIAQTIEKAQEPVVRRTSRPEPVAIMQNEAEDIVPPSEDIEQPELKLEPTTHTDSRSRNISPSISSEFIGSATRQKVSASSSFATTQGSWLSTTKVHC